MTFPYKPRGFALLSPEARRANASKAGKRARDLGVAHRFDSDEAREAGRKAAAVRLAKKAAAK